MKFFCKFILILLIPLTISASPYSRRSRISKDLDGFEQNESVYRKLIVAEEKIAVPESPSKYYTSSYHKPKKVDEPALGQPKEGKANSSEPKKVDFDFGISTGYISGETTYHISFDNHILVGGHGESKLEFPLDNSLLGFNAVLSFEGKDRILNGKRIRRKSKLEFKWLTNLNQKSGKMKDSDWIENDINYINWYNLLYGTSFPTGTNEGLDIYSESDTELNMDIFDISYTHELYYNDKLTFSPLFGYYYRNMRFTASNAYQYGYGPYAAMFTTTVPGLAIEYDVLYKFFYFGFKADVFARKNFNLALRCAYSPWVNVRDKDIHVVTGGWSDSTAKGKAYMINLDGSLKLTQNWTANLGYEFSDFDTDGTQHQSGGGNPNNSIFSSSWLANLGLNYSF